MGPIGSPEMSVKNYQSALPKIPEKMRFQEVLLLFKKVQTGSGVQGFYLGGKAAGA
jgi:hypothetical protein